MVFEIVTKVIYNNAGHAERCPIYHFQQDSKIITSYTLLGSQQCLHIPISWTVKMILRGK